MNLGKIYEKKHDNWFTPSHIYEFLMDLGFIDFNPLDIYHKNSFLKDYNNYFCNPPFSNIDPFVDYMLNNHKHNFNTIMLLPIRCNTNWFKKLVIYGVDIIVLGRISYNNKGLAPFDSMLVIFTGLSSRISFNKNFKERCLDNGYVQLSIFDL